MERAHKNLPRPLRHWARVFHIPRKVDAESNDDDRD
jgi:hypothetical protein